MIPLHSAVAVRRTPVVNRLLLATNIALWIYVLSLQRHPAALEAFYATYAFDWNALVSAMTSGAVTTQAFVPLVTHLFLHGGWLHVIGNMLYLWIFGDAVEDALGGPAYLVFYLLCGVVAAIGQGLLAPAPMVGASGAIAGVLGAYLVLHPTSRISTLIFLGLFISVLEVPALVVIGMFIVLQVVEGVAELRMSGAVAAQQIAYVAHVFGFVTGILLLPLLRERAGARRVRSGWGYF